MGLMHGLMTVKLLRSQKGGIHMGFLGLIIGAVIVIALLTVGLAVLMLQAGDY